MKSGMDKEKNMIFNRTIGLTPRPISFDMLLMKPISSQLAGLETPMVQGLLKLCLCLMIRGKGMLLPALRPKRSLCHLETGSAPSQL